MTTAADGPPTARCSARGCDAGPDWVLAWNNPSIHTPDRRKTWLACAGHREYLVDFLETRGFLREVVAWDDWQAAEH